MTSRYSLTTTNGDHDSETRPGSSRRSLIARLGRMGALVAASSILTLGCAEPESFDDEQVVEADASLYRTGTLWPKSTDGITYIPVCWNYDAGGDEDEKAWVRSAVEGQWGALSSIKFTRWDRCTAAESTSFAGIRISDGGGWSSEVGKQTGGTDMKADFDYDWDSGTRSFCSGQHRYCDGLIAVHEFGHALGFAHEQVRPDNASEQYCDEWQSGETTNHDGTELTDSYDTDSIMSYCAQWDRSTPHISSGDAEGVNAAYGAKPNNITDQVLLYEDNSYAGKTVALRPGSYSMASTTIGNDALTSLRIPSGWSVRVYQDSSSSGAYVDLTGDVRSLSDYGFNDVASNITVTGTAPTYAQIHGNTSYGGSNQKLYPGLYNLSDLTVGNDTVSSVELPSGWSMTLYENSNFSGSTYTLSSSDTNLIGEGWNDRASSIRVHGPATRTPVMIFKDANYTGSAQELWPGRYTDSGDLTIGNDAVSSLIVPTGWTVTLMANADCYGDFAQYTSSQSSLGGFNDETTCVVVQGP